MSRPHHDRALCPFPRIALILTGLCAGNAMCQSAHWLNRTLAHWPPAGDALLVPASAGETLAFYPWLRQTWSYDGLDWRQLTTTGTPPNITGAVGCHDSTRQRLVMLLGGTSSSGLETWELNGSAWTRRQIGPMLTRDGHAMAFDSTRGVCVMFGGTRGSRGMADTWEWNGTSWRQVGSGGPYPRFAASMTFDSARGVTVLFGGLGNFGNGDVLLGDTWEWNGTYWREHYGIPGPPPRAWAGFAFDTRRNRAVLQTGGTGTFEWNGSSWTQVAVAQPSTQSSQLAFDAARGVGVMFDSQGSGLAEYIVGTGTASHALFGAGCAGPAGVPALAAAAGSLPRLGHQFTVQIGNLPSSPFNIPFGVLGFDNTTWNGQPLPLALGNLGFPGCTALLAPTLSVPLTNVGGVATWAIAIPVDLDLIGVNFFQQAAVLVPGFNTGGMVFSNGGHGVIGPQ